MNLSDAATIIGPLLIVGAILKHAFPNFPNRFIPLVTLAAGTLGYALKTGDWTGANLFEAFLVAASATGIHSGLKNTFSGAAPPDAPSAPPRVPVILLGFITGTLLFTGCATAPYKTAAAVTVTADAAADAWLDYYVWAKKQPGADQTKLAAQDSRAAAAWKKYQLAMESVYQSRLAINSGLATNDDLARTIAASQAAAAALVKLILELLPPERASGLAQRAADL